jgi:alpha-ketoglutarate-dependent taurine dioxygenase
MVLTHTEELFVAMADLFASLMLETLGLSDLRDVPQCPRACQPLEPVVIEDFRRLTAAERDRLRAAYHGRHGVAALSVLNPDDAPTAAHPLFDIAHQLSDVLPLQFALPHPMESHSDTIRPHGKADGTVKVHDVEKDATEGYREQGETSESFEMHHDGLGSGGTVETVFLYCDTAPLWGGFTFFQDICALSLELAQIDYEAFRWLFVPDAIAILRPRGKGALKVTCPVLYVNEAGRPQSCFRRPSGEYTVQWRESSPALQRARIFLTERTGAFDQGSTFTHFSRPGDACIIRNERVAHGRTRFLDSGKHRRCLSRKWYMRRAIDAIYKHVPGTSVLESYGSLFPDLSGPDVLRGEWNYEPSRQCNEQFSEGRPASENVR